MKDNHYPQFVVIVVLIFAAGMLAVTHYSNNRQGLLEQQIELLKEGISIRDSIIFYQDTKLTNPCIQ